MEIMERNTNSLQIDNLTKEFVSFIDVSSKTKETYTIALRQFNTYLRDNGISFPSRETIIDYREYLKEHCKPTTVNSYLIAVRNLYQFLEYKGISEDITKKVKGIKLETQHLKRGLSLEEIKLVLSNCKDLRETIMFKMMVNLGLRANEVVNIQLCDFWDNEGVTMMKVLGKARDGIKQDSIKIDNRLFEEIEKYVNEYSIKDYLFVSTSKNNFGGKLTTKTIRKIITDLFKKSNLDMDKISCHSTRHSTCEILLENGLPIQEVSQYMRHKSVNTTLVYTKELEQRKSLASNILADNLF